MNRIELGKNNLMEYDTFIFDLDGTLYYQKPFRIRMLCTLLGYVLRHPTSVRDLSLIQTYRKTREQWERLERNVAFASGLSLDERQFAYVAEKRRVEPEDVRRAVELFMLKLPLRVLPPFRDEMLAEWIQRLKTEKKTIVIYSDYPVEDKLRCLGIEADACFTSGDAAIGCMKPDPRGLRVILSALGCEGADAVMVGDRYEKDGIAAQSAGVDYIIVDSVKRERERLRELFFDKMICHKMM